MHEMCEHCQQPLSGRADERICAACGTRISAQPCCPDCQQPLDVLKACGATDYFCRHGHGLISRKRVLFPPSEP